MLIQCFVEFETEEKKKATIQANRQTASMAASEHLTDSEHESLRSGLASIMSGLDSVMATIKK